MNEVPLITEGEVITALEENHHPLMMVTDIIRKCRPTTRPFDSNHAQYRHVLRILHRLQAHNFARSWHVPEANVTIWYKRDRLTLTDDIPF